MPNGSYIDAQTKLVYRCANKNCCGRKYFAKLLHGQDVADPEHPATSAGQLSHRGLHFIGDFRGVGSTRAQHQLDVRAELVCRCQQVRYALLPGDPPDERHNGAVRVDPEFGEHRSGTNRSGRKPHFGVDAVADDMHHPWIQPGVQAQDVITHSGADRDYRVGGQDGGLFHPGRDLIAAAELLGFPGPHRFERVGGQDVRNAVEQGGQMPRQAGVPGM